MSHAWVRAHIADPLDRACEGAQMSARSTGRQIGEAFNPWRGACGFYVPDVISRIGPMMIVEGRCKFGDGHKRLMTLLVRRWGRLGPCFPSHKRNAADLGRSERSVKRWSEDLERFGLIARKRRGRGPGGKGLSNEYVFLWHHIYEVPTSPVLKRHHNGYEVPNSGYEVPDPALSKCQNGSYEVPDSTPPYKEETRTVETHTKETCSSSSSEAAGKMKKIPLSSDTRKPKTGEAAWYE